MQKQRLKQEQKLQLSPKQIQFLNLLQIPLSSLSKRIESELEENPALEETEESTNEEEVYYKSNNTSNNKEVNTTVVKEREIGLQDYLSSQLFLESLSTEQEKICLFIIGCLDENGFLSRSLLEISDDILFEYNQNIGETELIEQLRCIQSLEPTGVGARNLKECLLLQLAQKKKTETQELAIKVLEDHFTSFTSKNFERICKQLNITESTLKSVYKLVASLNPKPGAAYSNKEENTNYITPDFLLSTNNNEFLLSLNHIGNRKIKSSDYYKKMLADVKKSKDKDAVQFLTQKIENADWFANAIVQREQTLLNTMNCILEIQSDFFKTGDEKFLKPMKLLDVAQKIKMDISTVSRVTNSKYIETPFGMFLLKEFFSEAYHKEDGTTISTKVIKSKLVEIIEKEDKKNPFTDDQLSEKLDELEFHIARRTVSKYRQQLKISSSKLRREL
ncbi:MAG: RNA polymerase factor sigma-54 [Flavobacteriales bacterium]|tara:strand:- start:2505 stop:3848 length:1344 start_codon:yes stop_codon:yes gene_type:complete